MIKIRNNSNNNPAGRVSKELESIVLSEAALARGLWAESGTENAKLDSA